MIIKDTKIINENYELEENVSIYIYNDKITKIGKYSEIAKDIRDVHSELVLDGKKKLVIPGFYNIHSHVPMTLLRGYSEDLKLAEWLNKVVSQEDEFDANDIYYGAMLGIAEMLCYGIVSFSDMYMYCDKICDAVDKSGIKANISRGIVDFDNNLPANLKNFDQAKELYKENNNRANGRLKIDMAIHGEYTSNMHLVQAVSEYAKKIESRIHIHLSETFEETEQCKAKRNKTPTEYMNDCGVFDVPTLAAHCVYVNDRDIEILSKKNVTVAYCPISNLKLGSGVAPIASMLKKSINIAIGTDGVSSNNNFNIIEEVKLAGILQKGINRDASLMDVIEVFKMSNLNGAIAQGRELSGAIKIGNKADLVLVNIDTPNMIPSYNYVTNIVYSMTAKDIYATIVDGQILYENGNHKTIDMEKIKYEVNRIVKKITKK